MAEAASPFGADAVRVLLVAGAVRPFAGASGDAASALGSVGVRRRRVARGAAGAGAVSPSGASASVSPSACAGLVPAPVRERPRPPRRRRRRRAALVEDPAPPSGEPSEVASDDVSEVRWAVVAGASLPPSAAVVAGAFGALGRRGLGAVRAPAEVSGAPADAVVASGASVEVPSEAPFPAVVAPVRGRLPLPPRRRRRRRRAALVVPAVESEAAVESPPEGASAWVVVTVSMPSFVWSLNPSSFPRPPGGWEKSASRRGWGSGLPRAEGATGPAAGFRRAHVRRFQPPRRFAREHLSPPRSSVRRSGPVHGNGGLPA